MIRLDGSRGEGGGQILRSALSLSVALGLPFSIGSIRARRERPGLLRQHLTAVEAAAAISDARVEGARPGSRELLFIPRGIRGGAHRFAIGTAGSATLVLQTLLPPLLFAGEPAEIEIEGGTHNPAAPPFEFLDRAFLPLLRTLGARVEVTLRSRGFFPAGGGRIRLRVEPLRDARPLALLGRGAARGLRALAIVENLPESIADRELALLRALLGCEGSKEVARGGPGPGNALIVEAAFEHVTEIFTGFGERGVPAETVAERVAAEAREYLSASVPVGRHLADQLLLPLALLRGGAFRTFALTPHATTNLETIAAFLGPRQELLAHGPDDIELRMTAR